VKRPFTLPTSPWKRVLLGLVLAAVAAGVVLGALRIRRAVALRPRTEDVRIRVDGTRHFQTITGWEATAHIDLDPANRRQRAYLREAVARMAVEELGLTRLRLEARSSIENPRDFWGELRTGRITGAEWRCLRYEAVNDNADPDSIDPAGFHFEEMDEIVEDVVLPMKRRLEGRGERLFLNVNYVSFTDQCSDTRYEQLDPAEYAELVLAVYQHLDRKYGLIPDTWEVILEPDNTSKWWTGAHVADVMGATARALRAHGYRPRFIAPSTTSMARASGYFDEMVARDPEVVRYLAELSYHRYRGESERALKRIVERAARYNLDTAMLEAFGSGVDALHQDLTLGRNSAWERFGLAGTTKASYIGIDYSTPTPTLHFVPQARYFPQYFRYVRPGAVRIGASTSDELFDPVAFVNRDGRTVLVVNARTAGPLAVEGLPSGRYRVSYTTASELGRALPEVTVRAGGLLHARIPARGVITMIRE
jgi:hypothetical protein